MCGIAAIFSRQSPVAPDTIERATRRLRHRGPDGQRIWISSDGRVALGHARLSIIDLTTGDQPIASEDGRTRIIVNGEFYGFEEIQQELERSWPPCPSSIRRRWWNCSIAWTRWTRVPVWRTIRS